jgi:hypothetical protein
MIEVVINYDPVANMYKVYEPNTDTLFITASLGESFIKLSEFLQNSGMTNSDLLNCQDISYHIDSYTFQAIVESNVGLLKRLNTAPTGFMNSSQKFGLGSTSGSTPLPSKRQSYSQQGGNKNNYGRKGWGGKNSGFGGGFSQSSFSNSNRKFWNRKDY